MIAAVYGAMTIQTPTVKGPVIQSDIYGLARFACTSCLQLVNSRVYRIQMTPLAKIGWFCIQQKIVCRAMGFMARQTVIHRRRMLPQIRPSGFSMTLEAFQIDVLRLNQFICNGSMGIVAIRTFYFALPYGVMGLPQQLGTNFLMASVADLSLGGLCKVSGIFFMHTVAVGTCKPASFVFAAMPQHNLAFGMTFQADGALFFGGFR